MFGEIKPSEITLQKSEVFPKNPNERIDFSKFEEKRTENGISNPNERIDFSSIAKKIDDGENNPNKRIDFSSLLHKQGGGDFVPPLPDENWPDKLKEFEVKPDSDSKHPDIPDDAIKTLADFKTPQVYYNEAETQKGEPIQNKIDGLRREDEVEEELKKKYPESEGYEVISEAYLRDKDGNIIKDPVSGEARRIDFVVVKDGKVVDSVEVTSKTADKTEQTSKENRIRENGGNYIRDSNGNLVEIPNHVHTRIERRD